MGAITQHYLNKRSSSGTEVVCSSFGLVSVLLRQKTSPEVSEAASQLRNFLNNLDLSVISGEEDREEETEVRPLHVSRRLKLPESLAMVLSNMCAFGDSEARAIVSEIVEVVAVKRG